MRSFLQYPVSGYIGQIFTAPFSVKGVLGQSVPLTFNWISYQVSTAVPAMVVAVDMSNAIVAQKIQAIRTVYIDNTGSDVPIYVIFPDTQQVIVCQPNATLWARCYTAGMKTLIAGIGFITGDIPSTFVLFTNFELPSELNQEIDTTIVRWLASNTITRGNTIYNTNFGVPALGDQLFSPVTLPLTNTGGNVTVFNFGTGFIYITELVMVMEYYTPNQLGSTGQLIFESTGISGILASAPIIANSNAPLVNFQELFRIKGNIKIDGSQLWRFRWTATAAATTGTGMFYASFSTNPS